MKYKNTNHVRGEEWHRIYKFPSKCYKCGATGEKSDFIPLYVRMTKHDSHRILCRMCPACLAAFATEMGATIPE